MKPVIYVVANKGLSMSPGKLAAQVGHAVAGAVLISGTDPEHAWKVAPHQWLIVLEAQDGEHLFWISEYLRSRSIGCHRVVDEGVNEVRPFALTAVGVEILDKDSPEASYLSGLKRYNTHAQEERAGQIAFRNGVESRKWRNRFLGMYRQV